MECGERGREAVTDAEGAAVARKLVGMAHEEDGARPVTASMNYAKQDMEWFVTSILDLLTSNY
jgi:beta-galactosidase